MSLSSHYWIPTRWLVFQLLTHWGQVTHICVNNLTIIGSDNGLSPARRQAIIWTNTGMLLIGPLGTNFNIISREIHAFSYKKMHLKMSSGKWRSSCLSLNVLKEGIIRIVHFMNPPKKMKEHFFVTDRWKSSDLVNRPACPLESWKIRGPVLQRLDELMRWILKKIFGSCIKNTHQIKP